MSNFDEKVVDRIKKLEREVERLRVKEKQVFVPLTTPLTSTSWDGDSINTQATGVLIDLSATHGVPAGVKAVLVRVYCRDSASASTNNLYFALSSENTGTAQFAIRPSGLPNDYFADAVGIVPCDANGDVYYRSLTSGTGTMDVWLIIVGYWL
jgi:hypothetical protein